MQQAVERPPRTIMEVFKMLPEGTLAEIIDGKIYMSPSPVTDHQRIISRISALLFRHVNENELGEVFVSPFDVYLDEHSNAVQPDIIYVSRSQSHIIKDHIHGVPDLLIEVLSPGNKTHDTVIKKKLYETFGVKEYWIIDPATKEAWGFRLSGDRFVEIEKSIASFSSVLLNKRFDF
jgi:Uma2 family endonuclease